MRVLMLNYEFPPLGGGAGNATEYLLKEFSEIEDLVVDLITSSTGKDKIEQLSPYIKIHFLDIHKKSNLQFQSYEDLLIYTWRAFWLSRKLISSQKYDIVHVFFTVPGGLVAFLLNQSYIISLRGSDVPFYNPRFKWLDRLVLRHLSKIIWAKARKVIANSEGLKILALATAPKQEIQVISNGIDVEQFQPTKERHEGFVVLSTSRLIERKGIEYLIDGFAKFHLDTPGSKLILVGDGDLKDKLEKRVEQLEISSAVEFKGTIPHSQMPGVYQSADVFVLPSLNEGMSNSVLEAIASGLPAIVTNTGGTQELVDEENGIIVGKEKAIDITLALTSLYNNHELRLNMGKSSRVKAEKMSWKKVSNQYLWIYKK